MDDVGDFLEDQRGKVAMDRASLENDPPYMEMKTNADLKECSDSQADSTSRQKKAPNPGREENGGLSSQLGAEYELKKQRLQQELRLDYRRYVAQKKDLNAGEPGPQPQGLSLPIGERRSAKNKLRDERHKEYNEFLKGRAEQRNTKRSHSITSQVQASETAAPHSPPPPPGAHPELQQNRRGRQLSWKDASTLTETSRVGEGTWGLAPRGRRRWEIHRAEDSLENWERRPRRQRGRREEYSSEEEFYTDEEEVEVEFLDRRRPRQSKEHHYPGRRERKIYHRPDRVVHEKKEAESGGNRDEELTRKSQSATQQPNLQKPDTMRATERSRSAANKEKAEFATGLMIGVAEGDVATQLRKDRYRQELLEQMAEQQRNKKKEKELELRVAATGAIDPEKQPDRIKQFGAVNRDYEGKRRDVPYRPGLGLDALGTNRSPRPKEEKPSVGTEERGPPEKPRMAFPSPPLDYSTALGQQAGGGGVRAGLAMGIPGVAPLNEDFHRSLSSTLGELVAPRITGIPAPLPPTLPDTYRTPYDEAYYYYGARNPLDPNLSYYVAPGRGVLPMVYPSLAHGGPPPPGLNGRPGGPGQRGAVVPGLGVGVLPGDRPRQSKENVLSYQEALREQIQEREQRKRRDREERERYDAKLEAEMRAYDPWGRGGAGAPLRDNTGNLISDLNHMHRTNEEAYVNPESRARREALGHNGRSGPNPRVENRVPSAHKLSGFPFAQPSPFARGNVFTDQPTPQQLHEQDTYKDYLKKQIEEKRRKEAESRERTRMEEEREEKRLAEQRACIQQEFEEEQARKKRKEIEQSAKNEELMRQAEERRREEERKRREEEERETFRLQHERQRQARLAQREPSPPIPALQKKLDKQHASRAPSAVRQFSSRTVSERSMSAPHSPPVPARRNQLRATEDNQGVISKLSTMRNQLRSEQRKLEGQLGQLDREDTPLPSRHRGRPPVDVFDMARKRAQVSRRPTSGEAAAAHVNMQNIREFNQLKYRDSASREELRHIYPDPPSDEQSLDIQQQALLREQQRRITSMRRRRRRGEEDFVEVLPQERPNLHHPREKTDYGFNRKGHVLLESDSAFFDHPRGGESPAWARQPSAQDRDRRRPGRRRDTPDELVTPGPRGDRYQGQPDAQSLLSVTSMNRDSGRDRTQHHIPKLEHLDENNWGTGPLPGDEEDNYSLRSSPYLSHRRVSVETVATEPWLRPGSLESVKRVSGGRTRGDKPTVTRDILDQEWDGPSTYHG